MPAYALRALLLQTALLGMYIFIEMFLSNMVYREGRVVVPLKDGTSDQQDEDACESLP